MMEIWEGEQKQVVHKVRLGDTIEGLSLSYSVPVAIIRERNGLDSDQIFTRPTLFIPNPKTYHPSSLTEEDEEAIRRDFVRNAFMSLLQADDRCVPTANFYLEQNDFNYLKAKEAYQKDLEWEKREKLQAMLQREIEPQDRGCLGLFRGLLSSSGSRISNGIQMQERAFLKRE